MASISKKVSSSEIIKKLKKHPEWIPNQKKTELSQTFSMSSFISGLSFIARIAVHAEILNHHPDIELSYGKVRVTLTTHDVKGLTNLDFELAKRIDNLAT